MKKNSIVTIIAAILCLVILVPRVLLAAKPSKQPTHLQIQFIHKMKPLILAQNGVLRSKRQHILHDQRLVHSGQHLTISQEKQLMRYANDYHIKTCSLLRLPHDRCFHDLLFRVNTLPVGLVLAQAINESNWGQSRFAKEGNNYFGIWCYKKGCGMVPHGRPKGQHYEVRRFANAAASIAAYYKIINTHHTYYLLRTIRAEAAAKGHIATAYQLAAGLEGYSTRRKAYIQSIRSLIQRYAL